MKIGCQTYTWQMLGDQWSGSLDDIIAAIAAAGYDGIEIDTYMLGAYRDDVPSLQRALDRADLPLAALAHASPTGFTDAANWATEMREAEWAVQVARAFPGTPLILGGAASPDRTNLAAKRAQAAAFYSAVARRGRELGVIVGLHPHSHHGSILESAEEYDDILARTAPDGVMFGPDTGHIVRGGQDLMACLTRHVDRMIHIHFKDADSQGNWRPLGQGVCDFPAVMQLLTNHGYADWIIAEEESAEARHDQLGWITRNRAYLRSLGV